MNFNLVSKNNMGVVATLILVILLSQSRFFNFLIETALGRAILILFILGISYINKILGIVAVLFIIIMFNQSSIGYIEGYTGATSNSVAKQDKLKMDEEQLKLNKLKLQNEQNKNSTTTSSTTNAQNSSSPSTSSKDAFVVREGFNTIDRESKMLRGKRSNEVPVFSNARSQNEDVEPTDKSVFSDNYSSV